MNADFSRTLALLRQEKEISQRKAAADLGISQALLSHYENGVREPGLAFVKKACDYYHVSADYLLGRTLDRDGGMIDSDELYDSSDEKGTLRGSIAATLQKKLLVNTVNLLFELLGKTNCREAVTAAGQYLGTAIYPLYRALHRAAGGKDAFFALDAAAFSAGASDAAMLQSRALYRLALERHAAGDGAFPAMDAETLTFTVTFNRCTAFALLNFKATSIRAVVKDGDGLVMYDRTVNTLKDVDGYWKYYFLPLERIVDQAVTNIPMSPVATLEVTLTQEGGPALGQVIAGQAWPIGTTQYNTRLGIRDYSRKDTDEFGNTRLVKRANAKRTSLPLYLPPSRLDSVREILARMHGLPALWLGDDNEGIGSYQSLTVWGWLEDWNATVIGPNEISMTIDIQGLK